MHKNTAILIAVLAVIAALLIGINVGRKLSPSSSPSASPTPTSNQQLTINNSPSPTSIFYQHKECGISFQISPDFKSKEASDGATFTHATTQEQINVVCLEEIPKPPLPEDKIEEITVDGIKTNLYHDASAKDGTPVDVVIFIHPKTKLEVGLFGFGERFQQVLSALKISP